jgi:hypothetical protein
MEGRTCWTAVRATNIFATPGIRRTTEARVTGLGATRAACRSLAQSVAAIIRISLFQVLDWGKFGSSLAGNGDGDQRRCDNEALEKHS